ncbi:MAG TPA: proline--tRNA ligase [Alphaproteobacteria bacterium]
MTLNVTRQSNYPDWYQAVITAADMAENSSVRGCMVIKPWGFGIWERLRDILDKKIKDTGHENAYFPLFIPLRLFEKEAEHIDGFAKEMAMVTHTKLENKDGKLQIGGELEEPLVVRPTSEMIISECFSNWVQSYRDLPLLINQWANIVRWEMRTRLFLRTSEFLWQEGHTAHATQDCAEKETLLMLEQYRQLIEDNMAIPVILGRKSENERFPGAVETYTLEGMMQDGRALQMGTSHYLGQTFAKASNIRFQDEKGEQQYVHTTSWGVSTRLIGGLIMAHSDDLGLRLPPRIAPKQIIIVPILRDGTEEKVMNYAAAIAEKLKSVCYEGETVRVQLDKRDRPAPDKKWEWVKKGAPLILEIGPRDVDGNQVAVKNRLEPEAKATFMAADDFIAQVPDLLGNIQSTMYDQAKTYLGANTRTDITTVEAFKKYFEEKNEYLDGKNGKVGFIRAPWSGDVDTSEPILKELNATIRCLPLDQKSGNLGTCVLTGKPAVTEAIFARSY